jgi:starvation-inducible DNA-binding protein
MDAGVEGLDWLSLFGHAVDGSSTQEECLSVDLTAAIGQLLSLYIKTKYFHWLLERAPVRSDQLLLEEQAEEIFATAGLLAAHVKQRNEAAAGGARPAFHHVTADSILTELQRDTSRLASRLKTAQARCRRDTATTAHLLLTCIDETEARLAFLAEAARAVGKQEQHSRRPFGHP